MNKPQINTHGFWLSDNPSKNYLFHLLRVDIERAAPKRSLDAGSGELRNLWMFPGEYVGISHNRPAYHRGLTAPSAQQAIKRSGPPHVYLMRLERDFSFLGLFDLSVCTQTLFYTEDPLDVARRLAARVRKSGTLLLDDDVARAEDYRALLLRDFDAVDLVYWGLEGSFATCTGMPSSGSQTPPAEFTRLFEREIAAPNIAAGHQRCYLRATGKKSTSQEQQPAPEMLVEGNLRIVKDDIPFLKLND